MGAGDLALKPRQCRQQTGRLPLILPVLPILFRALVVAPRGVPSLGVSGQSQARAGARIQVRARAGAGIQVRARAGAGVEVRARAGAGVGVGVGRTRGD